MPLDKRELLEIYPLAVEEEHRFIEAHQVRVQFIIGLFSALVAGTVAGAFKASHWYEFGVLAFGPAIIMAVAVLLRDAPDRFYARYLEAVTSRAKIEDDLGLTASENRLARKHGRCWPAEPIVPTRHLTSRMRAQYTAFQTSRTETITGSEAWVRHHLHLGYNRSTRSLLVGGFLLGVLLFCVVVSRAVYLYQQPIQVKADIVRPGRPSAAEID